MLLKERADFDEKVLLLVTENYKRKGAKVVLYSEDVFV
jgi:hypothetical protein